MRVLITGRGTSGSWKVRGEQLGGAIGATVKANATAEEMAAHDVVVLVKRPTAELAAALRACGRIVVWDAVDFWPQPTGNSWSRDAVIAHAHDVMRQIGARAVIGATAAMSSDLGSDLVLEHHGWDRGRVVPRAAVRTVGYEGNERYLGEWRRHIEAECTRRRWSFVVNPPRYTDCDIVVAFRGAEFTGYAPRHWKSNVKLANAQIAGIPFVGAREEGYLETSTGWEELIDTPTMIGQAFDRVMSYEFRCAASEVMHAAAPKLGKVADEYRAQLEWIARS